MIKSWSFALFLMAVCTSGPGFAQSSSQDAEDDATCTKYGAQPGTEVYVACRLELSKERMEAAIARERAQQADREAERRAQQEEDAEMRARYQRLLENGLRMMQGR